MLTSPGFHGLVRAQRGAVLVIALIFLLLLTILAVAASSSSMLQLRMSGNLRNAQQAQMSADTALRGAEWQLWTRASQVGRSLACDDGAISADGCIRYDASSAAYAPGGAVYKFRHDTGWISPLVGHAYTGPGDKGGYTSAATDDMKTARLAENPTYIIEDMGRVLPPGAGSQHESGATGTQGVGPGSLNLHAYRITARATGGSDHAIRVLQSTFDAQTNN